MTINQHHIVFIGHNFSINCVYLAFYCKQLSLNHHSAMARPFVKWAGGKGKLLSTLNDNWSRPKRVGFLYSIWWWWVVGRLRQSSASLHPPFGTSFLREPLTRPRPATLCQSLPTTIQRPALMVFQLPLSCSEHISLWFLLYERHTFWDYAPATPIPILLLSFLWTSDGTSWSRDWTLCFRSRIPAQSAFCCGASVHGHL